jgi:ferrous iron transport protein A
MLPLIDLRPEEMGVVVQIMGGRGLRQRLALRGIKEGVLVRVISSSRGPVVTESCGGQIAMGRGMARKIIVVRQS